MGIWESAEWVAAETSGISRRDRKTGSFRTYLPDTLVGMPLVLGREVDARVAEAEQAVRRLDRRAGADLAGVSRYLLRSEAIASSRIEGIAPNPRNVALAELGLSEDVSGISEQAQLVANNMTIVKSATTALVAAPTVQIDDVVSLQRALLPDAHRMHGVRTRQNWIGGSGRHPLDADFVPPAPQRVHGLLDDWVTYLNGAAHSPVIQAALVHAQFETIHPFADGNGRVGRALIHTVLARRGLTSGAVLPVSLVLSTLSGEYVAGLTAYRHAGAPGSSDAIDAVERWITTFADAVIEASIQALSFAEDLDELRGQWNERLDGHRRREGRTRRLRSDSAVTLVLRDLPGSPVLTPATVQRIHDVTAAAAVKALDELEAAGILETRAIGKRRRAYIASEVLDLVAATERRLASTRFDTRLGPPVRPVPVRPPTP
ncbi:MULTISPECIES: Fic family protein [unclassified Brevibacterium]|uniref:Fic family protein n=1 Tax=unclassified Brevibacterium TaxID=2614124 RepID=UPI0020C7B5DA|nr:Fic family protein [Brevibacterium sp. CS2]